MQKYFGTDGIRGKFGSGCMTLPFIQTLGHALAQYCQQVVQSPRHLPIIIGQDTRESGDEIVSTLANALQASGHPVYCVGVLPTPAISFLTKKHAILGVMVTASHNPYTDNGIKLFSADGFKLDDAAECWIESACDRPQPLVGVPPGQIKQGGVWVQDFRDDYITHCKQALGDDYQASFSVVVDCAHGAASTVAQALFAPCCARLQMLHASPDGRNINDACGALHSESLQNAVLQHHADIGVALDGDGDRLILVDDQGQCVDGDEILYILARYLPDKPAAVIGTQMSNLALAQALDALAIPFERVSVGDRYVLARCREWAGAIGGENSGHIIHLDYGRTGDGQVAALLVLSIMHRLQKSLRALLEGFVRRPQVMVNVPLLTSSDVLASPRVVAAIHQTQALLGKTGRLLVRLSGTEPLCRVMVEAENITVAKQMADRVAEVIQSVVRG